MKTDNASSNRCCMLFTNDEISAHLIAPLLQRPDVDLKILSQEDLEIDLTSAHPISFISFDGDQQNLFMGFFGHQTSIYVQNEEIMFIDEHAKYNYTTSDTHGNIVYEGAIRGLGNAGKLALFTEVVDCLIGASEVEVVATEVAMESDYKKYPYYRSHTYEIHVKNSAPNRRTMVFENITIIA